MALLSNLQSLVISDGNYTWDDVYSTLDSEVPYAIFNGTTTVLTDAIAAEFPLLNVASTVAAVTSDVSDLNSAVNGASSIASAILADGSVSMTADLNLDSNGLANVSSISGAVFIDDDTMASASATTIASSESIKAYIDNAVDSNLKFEGGWDASTGTFPGAGAAQAGYFYKVDTAGTVDGQVFNVGDSIYAIVDNASTSTYAANWLRVEGVVENDASTISIVVGYTAVAGTVSVGDTVQQAIEKLDGNVVQLDAIAVKTVNGQSPTAGAVTVDASQVSLTGGYAAAAGTVAASDPLETAVAKLDARVYGTERNLFQALPVTTTTSTTFQDKINATTSVLPVGEYKLGVDFAWNHDANNNDFEARLQFDGANVGQDDVIIKAEPKDNGGNFSGTGSNQRYPFSMNFHVSVTTPGAKSVLLQYRTDSAGVESSIWDASIEIIRTA